jgi:hypothetical protein
MTEEVSLSYTETDKITIRFTLVYTLFGQQNEKIKYSGSNSNRISRNRFPLYIFMNEILIYKGFTQVLEMCHPFKAFFSYRYVSTFFLHSLH